MDATTIVAFAVIVIADVIFFMRERKYSLLYKGSNKFGALIPALVLAIILYALFSKSFKPSDLMVIIPMIPLAFLGNKCGISENGILLNCYLTSWDKVNEFSIEKHSKNRYVLQYKTSMGIRKVYFKNEIGEEVDKYLSGMRKLRHRRVK